MIAFFAYELVFSPKEPYIPLRLFRNRDYNAVILTVAIVAMAYYGFRYIFNIRGNAETHKLTKNF